MNISSILRRKEFTATARKTFTSIYSVTKKMTNERFLFTINNIEIN